MQLVIMLLFAFFCAVAFMQYTKKEWINSGARDELIRQLLADYKILRNHTDDVGVNVFAIGYAMENHKGRLRDDDEALAVRILDEKGARRDGAAALGMDVIETGGRYFYQFPVRFQEKMSGAEMTAVLVRIKEKLEHRYPDDLVNIADTYITVVVDGKKLLAQITAGRPGMKLK